MLKMILYLPGLSQHLVDETSKRLRCRICRLRHIVVFYSKGFATVEDYLTKL